MRNKGLTLIEVIFSLALIGLITVTFLPMITFGVKNTFSAMDFTNVLFEYQEKVEEDIASLRDTEPDGLTKFNIFGKEVKGHNIHVNDDSSGEIYMFLPKRIDSEPIPLIESPPVIDIRRNGTKINISPEIIDLFDNRISLFVKEIDITPATQEFYLMSVYRWYMSSEMDSTETPSDNPNQYFIVKEWNEAKKQLSFEDSSNLKFIPNIKDSYNIMVFSDVKDSLGLSDEDFINTFGNRYIRYGVTPFSLRGRIGREELSNAVYVEAPRIELLNAVFSGEDKIILTFKEDISDLVDISNIILNESIGPPLAVYRDESNHKRLIMEFNSLDTSEDIPGNRLLRGAVQSEEYGKISIWHNGVVEGEFTIYDVPPVPVESVSISEDSISIAIGESYELVATVSPNDATDKSINWTSNNPDIVSVDSNGRITGISNGTATIRAQSASNPTVFDEILITVLPEEQIIIKELEDALAEITTLRVNNLTDNSPTIDAPADSNGIVYTLTSPSPDSGTPRITLRGDRKRATVTRHRNGNTVTGSITLRATKSEISQEVVFTVRIPRRGNGSVTVYR